MKLLPLLGIIGSIASIIGLIFVFSESSTNIKNKYSVTTKNISSSQVIVGDSNQINIIESDEETDLYLYFSTNKTINSANKITKNNNEISKEILATENLGDSFEQLTNSILDLTNLTRNTTFNFTIINEGKKLSENVWIKLIFPNDIKPVYFGNAEQVKYSYKKILAVHELYFQLLGVEIQPKKQLNIAGAMIIKYYQFDKKYPLHYVIGDSSGKQKSGVLILKVQPTNVEYSVREHDKGRYEFKNHSYQMALKHFKAAIKANPKKPAHLYMAENTYIEMNDYKNAELLLKKSLKIGGDQYYEVWGNIGAIEIKNKEYKNAIKSIKKALEINPDSEGDKYNLETARIRLADKKGS